MLALIPRRRFDTTAPVNLDWVDRFFSDIMPSMFKENEAWLPAFDISETDDQIVVKADLPGVDPKELNISVTGNTLTITGEKKDERTEKEKSEYPHRIERRYGCFSRQFMLPAEVRNDGIEANYKNGVLILTIPKTESVKARKIEVKAN